MNLYQNNDPDRQGHHLSILRSHYQFLLEDSHDSKGEGWEMRMVRAYHARLFKEYCLADLSIPGKVHEQTIFLNSILDWTSLAHRS